jgi:probable rRNA maturation factor
MPTYDIDVQCDLDLSQGQLVELKTAILKTLYGENIAPPCTLAVLITGDRRIQELNRHYRDLDAPTDVLSFPAGEPMPGMAEISPHLGDIIISLPYATRQAAERGHSVTAELQLLTIHGLLHLLGYDHAERADQDRMWEVQLAVLAELGLPNIVPDYE